ncbi:MAG TPA: NDP-sugar synthase [bacterium]|nr:NDP-sugar synthase [bacterium]HOL34924.1 NDP-sugar synthase [bacterium]HPP08306.1 NDP-sugar synthase [bacterium]
MILLGGFGTRLRPFTLTTPKSLLPVACIPLIYYQFELLAKHGINSVILAVNPHCKRYRELFSMAKSLGIKLYLSCEKKPMGTAGAIKNAKKFLQDGPFFVFNGDILTDCNLTQMLQFHKSSGADVSIAGIEVQDPAHFGVIIFDQNNRIKNFIEKPQQPVSKIINAGIYIIQPDVVDEIPSGREVSIEKETFPQLIEKGRHLYSYIHTGYWMDVGTIDSYKKANFDAVDGRIKLEHKEKYCKEGAVRNIQFEGKLKTGKNVVFGENVVIKGTVIIGDNCYIGNGSVLQDVVLFKDVFVGKNCLIENSIIGNSVIVEENCEIKNIAVGDRCHLCQYTRTIKS